MKKSSVFVILLSTVFGLSASVACAAPCMSANYGIVWLNDAETNFSTLDFDGDVKFDRGYLYTISVGYEYLKGDRIELEYGIRKNDVDEFSAYGYSVGLSEDAKTTSFMLNGFHEFFPKEKLTPFVGGGIGIANVEFGSADDDVFAYQLALGLACEIYKNTKVDLQYRYFATDNPQFSNVGVEVEAKYTTHNLMVGLRYSF